MEEITLLVDFTRAQRIIRHRVIKEPWVNKTVCMQVWSVLHGYINPNGMGGGVQYTPCEESGKCSHNDNTALIKQIFVWYCLSHNKYLKFYFKINEKKLLTYKLVKTETWCIFPPTPILSRSILPKYYYG